MKQRFLVAASALMGAAAFVWLSAIPIAGQAPAGTGVAKTTATAKPYIAPKTPDGQPDLQGFWSSSTYVPLERPNNVTKSSTLRRRPRRR